MRSDELYEISDMREIDYTRRLEVVGVLQSVPGGVQVHTPTGRGEYLPLDESNFEWGEQGRLYVTTDDGMVAFLPVDREFPPDVMLLMPSYDAVVDACL